LTEVGQTFLSAGAGSHRVWQTEEIFHFSFVNFHFPFGKTSGVELLCPGFQWQMRNEKDQNDVWKTFQWLLEWL